MPQLTSVVGGGVGVSSPGYGALLPGLPGVVVGGVGSTSETGGVGVLSFGIDGVYGIDSDCASLCISVAMVPYCHPK